MNEFLFGGRAETVIQAGHVVEDLDVAMATFTRVLGAGPWYRFRVSQPREGSLYRGCEVTHDLSIALAFHGTMMLELIQQHDEQPSVFRDGVAQRGYGLHHWGIGTRRFDERLAGELAQGKEMLYTARTGRGARIAYFEGPTPLHAMVEFIEITETSERFYAGIAAAGRDWNGKTLEWAGPDGV